MRLCFSLTPDFSPVEKGMDDPSRFNGFQQRVKTVEAIAGTLHASRFNASRFRSKRKQPAERYAVRRAGCPNLNQTNSTQILNRIPPRSATRSDSRCPGLAERRCADNRVRAGR